MSHSNDAVDLHLNVLCMEQLLCKCVNDRVGLCDAVFSQGDKGTSWYIIWKGSINVITHGKVKKMARVHFAVVMELDSCGGVCTQGLVTTLHEGEDFGQLALLNDAPRAATIILREDNCHFLRVDKQDFIRILKVCLRRVVKGRSECTTPHFYLLCARPTK